MSSVPIFPRWLLQVSSRSKIQSANTVFCLQDILHPFQANRLVRVMDPVICCSRSEHGLLELLQWRPRSQPHEEHPVDSRTAGLQGWASKGKPNPRLRVVATETGKPNLRMPNTASPWGCECSQAEEKLSPGCHVRDLLRSQRSPTSE